MRGKKGSVRRETSRARSKGQGFPYIGGLYVGTADRGPDVSPQQIGSGSPHVGAVRAKLEIPALESL